MELNNNWFADIFRYLGMPIYLAMGITSIIYMLIHDMSLMIVPQVMGVAFGEFVLLAIPYLC